MPAPRPTRRARLAWPRLWAVPVWLGPWMLEAPPPPGIAVTRPPSALPGSTLRVAPVGSAAVSGAVAATFDFVDRDFDGGVAQIHLAAPASAVQAQLRVDDQPAVALAAGPTATVAFGAGRRLTLAVQVSGAVPQGWQVFLQGLQFDQRGWRLAYAHDAAGLRARAHAPDHVELGADPDWAELGWPVAGSVAATRGVSGGAVRGVLTSTLPAQGFKGLLTLDNVPRLAAEAGPPSQGPFSLELGGARRLALVLHAEAEQPADGTWRVELAQLRLEEPAAEGGCAARGAATPPGWSALAAALTFVARWRYRQRRCA